MTPTSTRYIVRWLDGDQPRAESFPWHSHGLALTMYRDLLGAAGRVQLVKQHLTADGWKDVATIGPRALATA